MRFLNQHEWKWMTIILLEFVGSAIAILAVNWVLQ